MGAATTLSAPQDQVEALIRQVAAENDLAITDQLSGLKPAQTGSVSVTTEKEDQLERRFVIFSCRVLCTNSFFTNYIYILRITYNFKCP